MRKIIIDCDPGIDDLLTLFFANASKELDILGITTVSGNATIDNATRNALQITSFLKMNVNVYKGAKHSLFGDVITAEDIHGSTGLGSIVLPNTEKKYESVVAHKFIAQEIIKYPNEVEILAIGPLTNISKLFMSYPNLVGKIKMLTIMGGGHKHGNVTPTAEFNIYADPEAAKMVFESGVKIRVIPLDATMSNGISEEIMYDIFRGKKSQESSILETAVLECINISKKFGIDHAHLHDPLALFSMLHPDSVYGGYYDVTVDFLGELTRGKTVVDSRHENTGEIFFAESYNFSKFIETIKEWVEYYEV